MSRVLVTGGAGYIGSVVADALLRSGHDVVVFDSLIKGHREALRPGAVFVHGELEHAAALRRCLTEHRIEAVVHLAAHSLVGESVSEPSKYYRNNLVVGLQLLDVMRECGVSSIVFSSTAAVYGSALKQPIDETDPLVPTNPYGETKLALERALEWYGQAYGLRHISLRYFNAAGAIGDLGERHDPETHLVPLVLRVAAGEAPHITIYGNDYPTKDGTCVRDYVHVADIATAHVLALEALADGSKSYSSVFNIGCGGGGYSVRDVIESAERITGCRIPISFGSRRPGDPATLVANPARIIAELGWQAAQQSLDAILSSAWEWKTTHQLASIRTCNTDNG
jgi:UDP-glucose 4-epimerase